MILTPELVSRALQVVVIDLVLSGDNAVVIGLAAYPLPRRQRSLAIALGGLGATVLRIGLTGGAALLLEVPAVKLVGGALLLWIAFKLLESEAGPTVKAALTLRGAVVTILAADLVMSLDNVLGVAAASNGDWGLLIFGLVVSMAIVLLGGGLMAEMVERLWWLAYFGSAVIAWTGIDMLQEDSLLAQPEPLVRFALDALVTLCVVVLAHQVHRRLPPTRRTAGSPRPPGQ